MTDREKLELMEGVLEVQRGSLKMESSLVDTGAYDSVAMLSLMVMLEKRFGAKLDSDRVQHLVTIRDIADLMEGAPLPEQDLRTLRPHRERTLCEKIQRKLASLQLALFRAAPARSGHSGRRFA